MILTNLFHGSLNYKPRQNTWEKMEKSSNIG